ncbi:MAG: AMP-binding protein [Mycobacteriales bacterium]
MALLSYARRLADLADAAPDRPSVTCGDASLTRRELNDEAERLAYDLLDAGATAGRMVTIALPNGLDWFVAFAACWKIGAVPQPVSARLPLPELEAIVALGDPAVVLGVAAGTLPGRTVLPARNGGGVSRGGDRGPLPDAVSPAWKAPTSGGSTGRPKIIVSGDPSVFDTETGPLLAMQPDGCLVMPGPLYHNGPLIWSWHALLHGSHVAVLPRFDAEETLAAIARHGADVVYLVPTMMKRIWRLPTEVRDGYDLSSLRVVWHLAEPCPEWLKQAWIDWLGPERIYELYGGTEGQLSTVITGPEWLAHRGSVGRPTTGRITIRDEAGAVLPPGTPGEVWLQSERETATYHYLGAEARTFEGGWESLGDMGRLDADGYLYLGDRRSDMILTGGSNVYPAEVEAALQEHPDVHSCAVIGLPDEDKGSAIHAIVQADPGAVTAEALRGFLAERLVGYKVPRTFEFVEDDLRDDAGKVRRSALREERLSPVR